MLKEINGTNSEIMADHQSYQVNENKTSIEPSISYSQLINNSLSHKRCIDLFNVGYRCN